MARIRSVSLELRTSETAAAWPREVRYAWVLLWGYLDDYGRGQDNVKVIGAELFPLDDDVTPAMVGEWLELWESAGSICRYEHDGKRYLHAVNWSEYQKPQHPGKVRLPPCSVHEKPQLHAWLEGRKDPHQTPSGNSHEDLLSPSPTSRRGSKEVSKEEEAAAAFGPAAFSRPFPRQCPDHQRAHNNAKCVPCQHAREAHDRQPPTEPRPLPPLCGQCDNRWVETESGAVARCPRCNPRALTS